MPTSLGPAEILVILVVALLVLGPKKLPQAGRQVGRALAEVRRWSSSIQSEIRDVIESEGDESAATVDRSPAKATGDPVPQAPAPPTPPAAEAIPEAPAPPAADPSAPSTPAAADPPTDAGPPPPKTLPGPTVPTNGSAADPPRN